MIRIEIQNNGTGNKEVGNYKYRVLINDMVIEYGDIEGHERKEGWRSLLLQLVDQSSKSELEALIFKEDKWQSM